MRPSLPGLSGALLALTLLGAPARAQEPSLILTAPDTTFTYLVGFGLSLSAADVTGDGVPDLLVSDPYRGFPSQAGLAHVYDGDGVLRFTLDSPDPRRDGVFGSAVAFVGDVDGDGVSDMLVGAPGENSVPGTIYTSNNAGRAHVFSGATGANLFSLVSPLAYDYGSFGAAVAGPGDVTGDGVPDLLVGAPYENPINFGPRGRAYVFSGADGALVYVINSPEPEYGGEFGSAVEPAGDPTADGVPDFFVAARLEDVPEPVYGEGRVHLYSGADGAFVRTYDPTASYVDDHGYDLAVVGDLDADGVQDFVAGAPGTSLYHGAQRAGVAIAYSGATGDTLRSFLSEAPFGDNRFGTAVAPTGDVDLDGVPDVLIGAPFDPAAGVTRAGRASVRSGADGSDLLTFETPNPVLNGAFGNTATWVDFDGDGQPDPIIGAFREGRVYVYTSAVLRAAIGAAPVAAALAPLSPPVVVPAGGGSFSYRAQLTNITGTAQTVDAWITATLPSGAPYGPVVGPRQVTLPTGATVTQQLTATVPAGAPPGLYRLTLNVGSYPALVAASSGFPFTKAAAAGSAAPQSGPPIEAGGAFFDGAVVAAAGVPAAAATLTAYPNPARDRLTVAFTLAAAADARVTLYDVLGRAVAVLLDGPLEAGLHEATLTRGMLPSGTYLARLETGGTAHAVRVVLAR